MYYIFRWNCGAVTGPKSQQNALVWYYPFILSMGDCCVVAMGNRIDGHSKSLAGNVVLLLLTQISSTM